MAYKVPLYTELTLANRIFVRDLPKLIGESSISAALNRLLTEARGCSKTDLWKTIQKAQKESNLSPQQGTPALLHPSEFEK